MSSHPSSRCIPMASPNIPSDSYEIVVIDEFHHAEAATYRAILDRLEPRELLGLTATPERADGVDVRSFFGGRTAAELRLWDALGDGLLTPFHYFGIADGTDLTRDPMGPRRLSTSTRCRTSTRATTPGRRIVLSNLRDKVTDVGRCGRLGFCVSVDHAHYMARVFREAGVPARAVTGRDEPVRSERCPAGPEGPSRSTCSSLLTCSTRASTCPASTRSCSSGPPKAPRSSCSNWVAGCGSPPDKPVLTALDFVGHQRKEFRFDVRYRALTGATRRGLTHQVEQGFPFLPSGSQIILDRQTQQLVLANIRGQLSTRWQNLVSELRGYGDVDLAVFPSRVGRRTGRRRAVGS